MADETELKRLYWHSRRGMLELDVLLVPFVQEVYPGLDAEDQARFRKLLECEDQDMFGWFMQRGEPEDADLRRMVRMILDRVHAWPTVPGGCTARYCCAARGPSAACAMTSGAGSCGAPEAAGKRCNCALTAWRCPG